MGVRRACVRACACARVCVPVFCVECVEGARACVRWDCALCGDGRFAMRGWWAVSLLENEDIREMRGGVVARGQAGRQAGRHALHVGYGKVFPLGHALALHCLLSLLSLFLHPPFSLPLAPRPCRRDAAKTKTRAGSSARRGQPTSAQSRSVRSVRPGAVRSQPAQLGTAARTVLAVVYPSTARLSRKRGRGSGQTQTQTTPPRRRATPLPSPCTALRCPPIPSALPSPPLFGLAGSSRSSFSSLDDTCRVTLAHWQRAAPGEQPRRAERGPTTKSSPCASRQWRSTTAPSIPSCQARVSRQLFGSCNLDAGLPSHPGESHSVAHFGIVSRTARLSGEATHLRTCWLPPVPVSGTL